MNALNHPIFRWLFAAQILSLMGIGLLTAALSLAAYRLGGVAQAGMLLSAIFVLKMIAYVLLAPVAEAALVGVARRPALIGLNVLRLALVLPLAFIGQWGAVAALTFLFFAASAAYTPLFQAVIPQILTDKDTYTQALSLSRLASTGEVLLTPVLVGAALLVIPAPYLFTLSGMCFAASILCLTRAPLAAAQPKVPAPFWNRATRGIRIYLNTPRLQGLLAAHFGLSLAMAWVLINTVVYAGSRFGEVETSYPTLMAGFGLGSAAMAVIVPRLIRRIDERRVIIAGAFGFAALTPLILLNLPLVGLFALWAGFGAAASLTLTPGGLVLVRSAADENRAAVFAAQFSLSHAGWLLAYPLAGWLATTLDLSVAFVVLGAACGATALVALWLWPANDPEQHTHAHPELPADHPHLRAVAPTGPGHQHSHVFHVDELHPKWAARDLRLAQ
ncbi:MFS transporter [Oceaniglobus ichthyenteri]|uniref:MFS transporter n=1 Tax=Oceaniglobus ichthyenteri TaxID=2136177 RepID=UPI0030B82EB3